MATHRCIAECFHGTGSNGQHFVVGQEATFQPSDEVPEHFEKIVGEDEPEAEEPASGKGGRRAGPGK
jgi:hypothetical protein